MTHSGLFPSRSNANIRPRDAGFSGLRDAWPPLIGVISVLMCLPFTRVMLSLSDEGVLANGAERLLHGQRLYADFFEFLPPGGFVLTAAWFSVAGISVLSMRLLAILLIAGTACLTFLTCRRASGHAPLSAALTLGWILMSQGNGTQLSHHWFTTCFAMVTYWAVGNGGTRSRRWPFLAGLAAGAGAMVTPTRGALAMLAGLSGVVHQRGHWRRVGFYVSGGSIAPCGLLLYLAWTGTSRAAFDAVIVFTATRYAGFQYVPFGSWADAQNIPLIAVFPAAFGLSLLIAAMRRFGGQSRRDIAFACAGFIGCFPRPDIFHIAFAVPLALPLLAGCVTRLSGPLRGSTRLAAAAITLLIMAPSLITYGGIVMESRGGITIQTALGEVTWFGPPEAAEMLRRIADLPANDRLLFYPLMALAPFLTGREDVSALDTYAPGYTLAAQYRDTCLAAVHRADYVVIDRRWTDPAALKNVFPAMRDPRPPATIAFEQALDRGFVLTAAEGMLELRRRQPDIDVTICSGIAE